MTHTPGPWAVKPGHSVVVIVDGSGGRIGAVDRAKYWESYSENDLADAHLIAAAPDMLAALQAARAAFNVEYADDGRIMSVSHGGEALRPLIAALDAALARATTPTA